MRKILAVCPNCGGAMDVTRLSCTQCETVILARYQPCRFCRLSPESLQFAEQFLRYRGNLKEMEREQGESYWTLRNRLGDVIREMGFEEPRERLSEEELASRRREVLDRLDAGEINAEEAVELLASLQGVARPSRDSGRGGE